MINLMASLAKLVGYPDKVLKCLNFGMRKVSPAKQLLIQQVGFVNPRHFSKTEVVQNTDLNILAL